jgi:ABC-type dipeptide/oligopeptide/nickel transport system permease subunit
MVNVPVIGDVVVLPALILGFLIGLVELYFVAEDEAGMHWFMHGMHAVPFALLFVFVNMNTGPVLELIGFANNPLILAGVRVAIGITAFIKIKAAASITGKGKIGESNLHLIVIMLLIIAAPYAWEYGLQSAVGDQITL